MNLTVKIRKETKALVAKEKFYTAQILQNLAIIEREKLFSDYHYPSLVTTHTLGNSFGVR